MRTRLCLATFVVTQFLSCLKVEGKLPPEVGIESELNVAYGELKRQKLDVFAPTEPKEKAPVLVFVHGGAWTMGSKDMHAFVGKGFAKRGIVTVLPNYRLHPEVVFPAFVEDTALAVQWVRKNIAKHGGDPDQIVLAGHSAGGHIVALLASDGSYLGGKNNPPEWIRGVIPIAGVYNVDPNWVAMMRKVFDGANKEDCMASGFLDQADPPFFLLHGEKDLVVPFAEGKGFVALLEKKARKPQTRFEKTDGHMTILWRFAGTNPKNLDLHQAVLDFIAKPQ